MLQAIIVSHSMGTLVARYFLECMGGADVSLMHVAIGPPFKGAVMGTFARPCLASRELQARAPCFTLASCLSLLCRMVENLHGTKHGYQA